MGADPEVPGGSPPASLTADGAVDLLAFADWVSAGQKGRATREAVEEKTYVAFLIDREEFGLPVESVREILRVGEVTRVPQAPPHIRGVTNVRGSILPVVEIRTRIGLPPWTRVRAHVSSFSSWGSARSGSSSTASRAWRRSGSPRSSRRRRRSSPRGRTTSSEWPRGPRAF